MKYNMDKTSFLLKDSIFLPVSEFYQNGLSEFVENEILLSKNKNLLLRNLSQIHILVGMLESENLLNNFEKKWKDILSEKQYSSLLNNKYFVLGYLLTINSDHSSEQTSKHIHFIEFIDTRIRGYNLASLMIENYSASAKTV